MIQLSEKAEAARKFFLTEKFEAVDI